MSGPLVTGDRVVVSTTGEPGFVTGYYLPGMDVRVLLQSGRFAVFAYDDLDAAEPPYDGSP